jgi:uncharacterized protein (DUF488 family)
MLYTIGHSNHSPQRFLELLRAHGIATLVDVRSWPASRRWPQFNRDALERALAEAGMAYLWFGKELGGKGAGDTAAPAFKARIAELAELAAQGGVTMMCAEEDPARCHRKHLLGKPLAAEGVEIVHIRGDGSLASDEAAQLSLFGED